jgi:cytidylate kinase
MESASDRIVVALDGPAGVGKSTVAMAIARELSLTYVETGAIYRAVAFKARSEGIPLDDLDGVAAVAKSLDISFRVDGDINHVFLDGQDVTMALRGQDVSPLASKVSAQAAVRAALLDVQRSFVRSGRGAVAEGRDIGTVVFPQASFKFFLTADVRTRALRRFHQLEEMGRRPVLAELEEEIAARDRQDTERAVAPLKAAPDAVVVDTSRLTADQVIQVILERIRLTLGR